MPFENDCPVLHAAFWYNGIVKIRLKRAVRKLESKI